MFSKKILIPDAFQHVRSQNTFNMHEFHQTSPPGVDYA